MTRFLIEALGFNNAARALAGIIGFTSLLAFLFAVPNPAHEWRKPESWLRISVWIDVHAFKNKAFCWFTVGMAFMFFGFYCVFFNLEEVRNVFCENSSAFSVEPYSTCFWNEITDCFTSYS